MPNKITIITPTFNRKYFIEDVIKSVQAQNFQDYEHIIIDDGSSDGTQEYLEEILNNDDKIKYHYKDNGGEASAVNMGWQIAKGEYVVIINSDDPQPPDLLKNLINYMDKNLDVGVGYPNWSAIDKDGKVIESYSLKPFNYEWMLIDLSGFPGPGAVLRKSSLSDFQELRDGRFPYVTDLGCWLRLGQCVKFGLIKDAHAYWRTHADGITTAVQNRRLAKDNYDVMLDYWKNSALPKYKNLKRKSMARTCLKCARKTYVVKDYMVCLRYLIKALYWSPIASFDYIFEYLDELKKRKK